MALTELMAQMAQQGLLALQVLQALPVQPVLMEPTAQMAQTELTARLEQQAPLV